MSPYDQKPAALLTQVLANPDATPPTSAFCAGFEMQTWRCDGLADHLMEWIADYALKEDELRVSHTNMYVRLKEAAVRVYTSEKYKRRGEVSEILLHAICRQFFNTIPFAPRVFYLTSSNDVVKSFDLVHVRYVDQKTLEIWLGEAKFYEDSNQAIAAAITSVTEHIDQGFLKNEKLLLGPQISKEVDRYQEIRDLFSVQTSLDRLFDTAVFPICVASDSAAASTATKHSDSYVKEIADELADLTEKIVESGLTMKIKILLIYVPLASKSKLAEAFDKRLKALS